MQVYGKCTQVPDFSLIKSVWRKKWSTQRTEKTGKTESQRQIMPFDKSSRKAIMVTGRSSTHTNTDNRRERLVRLWGVQDNTNSATLDLTIRYYRLNQRLPETQQTLGSTLVTALPFIQLIFGLSPDPGVDNK